MNAYRRVKLFKSGRNQAVRIPREFELPGEAAKLRFGAAGKGSERLTLQLERILSAIDIQPFDAPADAAYARLRARLEAAGSSIGGNCMLIAAQALATDQPHGGDRQ
ncbi:MAG: hypothetical protein ACYDD1_22180 [Caulobacteraceae bacterium]